LGQITEQFIAAAEEWSKRTGQPVNHLLSDIQTEENLKIWREVSALIMEPENMRRSENDDMRELFQEPGF